MKMTYGINDKVPVKKAVPLALQHVFTIFTGTIAGSTLLATGAGLDVNGTALIIQCGMLCCAIASLIQCLGIWKLPIGSKLPIITAGSYTLITPMVIMANNPNIGLGGAFGAAFVGSIILFFLGPLAIKYLHRFFTPAVTGSVVLAVGMTLITSAFDKMVGYNPGGSEVWKFFGVALFCAVLCIIIDNFTKGFIQSLSILLSMVVGYLLCTALGMIDFSTVATASLVSVPKPLNWGFSFPIGGILTICVVHIATLMENIGDTTSIVNNAEDRTPTTDELKKTIRGDALGSVVATFLNGLPVCSATQNAAVIAMSGCASRYVAALGSIIFGILAFFPKFAQILALIPNPVLGGVLLVAFGTIMSSGIRVIGMGNMNKRNFTIVSLACAVGIGGHFAMMAGALSFLPDTLLTICTGISGTALTALILNIILPKTEEDRREMERTALKSQAEVAKASPETAPAESAAP